MHALDRFFYASILLFIKSSFQYGRREDGTPTKPAAPNLKHLLIGYKVSGTPTVAVKCRGKTYLPIFPVRSCQPRQACVRPRRICSVPNPGHCRKNRLAALAQYVPALVSRIRAVLRH